MSWDEVIGRSKMDEKFRQEVSMALKIYDGAARSWAPESFTDSSQCGYRVEQAATFYTDAQLQAHHNISLRDVPGCTVTIQSETGQSLEGVVVESDEPRRLVYYMDVATKYGQALHSATDALRPNQGREVSEQYRKDLKAVPVFKNVMSLDAFKGKVEAIQTQKAAEKARAEMVSQNLQPQRVKEEEKEPESQAALAGSAEPASKEDDEDEIVDLSPQQTQDGLQGPSAASMPKAKVKPTPKKDRGRARGRGGRTAAAHQQSRTRSCWLLRKLGGRSSVRDIQEQRPVSALYKEHLGEIQGGPEH